MRVWPIDPRRAATGPAPSARARGRGRPPRPVARGRSEPDRSRPRRQGRRSRRGRHGRGVAAARRRRDVARSSARSPIGSRRSMRRSDDANPGGSSYISGWYGYVDKDLRTLLGAGARAVLASLLRSGRPRDVPRRALGRARRGGRRARVDAGTRAVRLALGRDRRADPVHVGCAPRHHALDEPSDLPAADVVLRSHRPRCLATARAMTEKRYLMAPGPTPVPPEVLAAGAAPIIHHRGPDFRELMLADARPSAGGLPDAERRAPLHGLRDPARSSRPS